MKVAQRKNGAKYPRIWVKKVTKSVVKLKLGTVNI